MRRPRVKASGLYFQVQDEVEPEDVHRPAEMTTLESRLGSLIQHDTITRVPAFKGITSLKMNKLCTQEVDFPGLDGLESAMGPVIEKSSKGIVSDIVKCIGDKKKHMRECTSWVASTDLDKMVMKNVSDIQGPALAIVLERLKSHGVFLEVHEKTRATRTGPTVKTTTKIGKSNWLSKQLAIHVYLQELGIDEIRKSKLIEWEQETFYVILSVELFRALRARLYDSNQNLIMATLTSISGLESSMGPVIEKSSKGIVSDIVKCIGENKKHMRECTSWVASTDLDKMVQYITPSMTPMTDAKLGADGRTDLFDRLSKQLAIQLRPKIRMSNQLSKQLVMKNVSDIQGPTLAIVLERLKSHGVFPEVHDKTRATRTGPTVKTTSKIRKSNWLSKQLAIQLLRPVAVAMTDKSADVCKAAEGFFGDIVRVCGPQIVKKNVRDIHGLALAIVLERLNSHGAFPEVHDKTRATGIGPTVKSTSKIRKCTGYGSKPESYVSSCVEGMEVVCKEFETTSKVPQGHSVDNLITEFHSCLAAKVSKTFDIRLMGASSKSCEYVLSTLMQVFEDKRFAHAVKKRTLDNLITEILLWLLDERVPRMHDGSQLLKVLNVLMLRILDNAERTSSFVVLISLLIPLDPSRWPSPPSNESFATRNRKFSNLVVKCLIKLTKDLQSTIDEVDLDHILQIIHLRGTAIKGHLSMVPIDMEPQPIILAYIVLNLQTLAAARLLTTTRPTGQTQWGDSMGNNPMPAAHCAGAQLKVKSLTDTDQSLKATSKIEKSNGYGSKPESRAVSSRGVSAKGSKAESIMSVQDKSRPMGSRLVFTPKEPQRERHPMPQPSVIGPTNWYEATPTSVEGMKVICQEFEAINVPSASTEIPSGNGMEIDNSDLTFGIHPFYIKKSLGVGKASLVLALGKFSGHSGLRINFSEQVIAEYLKRRNSWPKTNV
ncbi:protein MOR1 [Tanacetum coccineum]|uniref:Protein MOR1 n=1 Tax=Tanacetum coccineum TaxID=301880 RepID=A0ABQ5CQK9_9ASTR